eukprot:scaffold33987_cov144-Skeletonema_dohrnii-CCMP3373.AAC.3
MLLSARSITAHVPRECSQHSMKRSLGIDYSNLSVQLPPTYLHWHLVNSLDLRKVPNFCGTGGISNAIEMVSKFITTSKVGHWRLKHMLPILRTFRFKATADEEE